MSRLALVIALSLLPFWAPAQVVINHAALDQLAGISASPPAVMAPSPVVRRVASRRHIRKPAPVQIATAKPLAVAAIVPLAAKPAAPAPPPRAAAATAITFATGAADLPAGAPAALKPFCAAKTPVIISAAAPADPADPSSAMRLAMQRAFAVRGALIACGTASANILPRTATSSLSKTPDITQITEGR